MYYYVCILCILESELHLAGCVVTTPTHNCPTHSQTQTRWLCSDSILPSLWTNQTIMKQWLLNVNWHLLFFMLIYYNRSTQIAANYGRKKIRELQVNGLKVYGLTERIYCYLIAKEYEISYKIVNNDRARFKQFIKKNLKHGGPAVSRAHYLESYIRDYYRDRRIKHLKRKYKIEQWFIVLSITQLLS